MLRTNDLVTFFSPAVNLYSSVIFRNNRYEMDDSKTAVDGYCKFKVTVNSDNSYSFYSTAMNQYLSVVEQSGNVYTVEPVKSAIDVFCKFILTQNSAGNYSLLSQAFNTYVSDISYGSYYEWNVGKTVPDGFCYWNIHICVTSYAITNLQYNLNSLQLITSPPQNYQEINLVNHTSVEQTSSASFQYSTSNSSNWSATASLAIGVSTTVSCGIPLLAEGKVTVSATATVSYTNGNTYTTTTTNTYVAQANVPPNSTVVATLVVYQGTLNIPYTATVTATYDDGSTSTFNISSIYNGVNVDSVQVVYNQTA